MNKRISTLKAIGCGLLFLAGDVSAENFSIQVGDTVADGAPGAGDGRITVNTENDYYTFTGTAGQNVFVEEINAASAFAGWLRWELKSPGNATVFSSYLDSNNDVGRRTLPETGTYSLRVWVGAANAAYVGSYSFRVRAIPADPTIAIQIGDTITNNVPEPGAGNIEVPGAWDVYTFNATNGQLAYFEIPGAASSFQGNLYCELKSPSSNTVFSSYITAGNHLGRKVLNEAGTYRMRVFAQSNNTNHVGTYSIRIRGIAPDQYFSIQPGDTVTNNVPAAGAGNIEMPGAQDFYTFNATAGQSLSFEAISRSAAFNGWLQWELRSPTGALIFGNYFADGGRKTMPETGLYTIRVWVGANNTSYLGNYAFRIYTLPGDVRLNIQKGEVISEGVPVNGAGRIDEPGGLDTYTFDGLAGQRVNFEQRSAAPQFAGYLFWQVTAPSGTNWFSGYFPGNVKQRRTLPETGNYTIRIYANSPNPEYIGAYSFRTWCEVVANHDQLATLPDTALTVPLSKFACNDTLEIGDVPTIDLTNSASVHGGTIIVTNSVLVYTPPAGFSGVDSFTYRLRGMFGDDDFTTVSIRVGAGVHQGATVVSLVRENPTSLMVCLLGAPNQSYTVEQSSNLSSWSNIGQLTADATGSMTYNYTIDLAVDARFYRFRKQ
ncbi:MAG TPA: Ig-like domain-containing protein [Verrucomicrobiae bacterium]|nr:Ig-like domain-containing protein [Verrucomicrobiae bacterium]